MKEEFINNIVKEFSVVTEDDDIGMLANKLGAADLTGIPQLRDNTAGPYVAEHSTAVVTFYQKCECTEMLLMLCYNLIGYLLGCVLSKVFLHHVVKLNKLVTSEVGVAVVSCSDWPDVCDIYNITTYPTVLLFRYINATVITRSLTYTYITSLLGTQRLHNIQVT